MLDTFYQVFGHGYVPRWHADVIDPGRAYFDDPRQRLFVAVLDDEVVGTAAVRADGPKSPPHAPWIAERYPSGTTAQIFRVYVRAEHRRHLQQRNRVGRQPGQVSGVRNHGARAAVPAGPTGMPWDLARKGQLRRRRCHVDRSRRYGIR